MQWSHRRCPREAVDLWDIHVTIDDSILKLRAKRGAIKDDSINDIPLSITARQKIGAHKGSLFRLISSVGIVARDPRNHFETGLQMG